LIASTDAVLALVVADQSFESDIHKNAGARSAGDPIPEEWRQDAGVQKRAVHRFIVETLKGLLIAFPKDGSADAPGV
jgi:hypothetical protein